MGELFEGKSQYMHPYRGYIRRVIVWLTAKSITCKKRIKEEKQETGDQHSQKRSHKVVPCGIITIDHIYSCLLSDLAFEWQ